MGCFLGFLILRILGKCVAIFQLSLQEGVLLSAPSAEEEGESFSCFTFWSLIHNNEPLEGTLMKLANRGSPEPNVKNGSRGRGRSWNRTLATQFFPTKSGIKYSVTFLCTR